MTPLSKRKRRARFETLDAVYSQAKNRPVCVELHPTHMEYWLKGTRSRYTMPFSTAFMMALKADIESKRLAKISAKKKAKAEGGGA